MNQNYSDLIEQISDLLFKTIVEQEPNLAEKVARLDRDLLSLLRAIGLRVMSRRARSLAPFVGAGSLVNVIKLVSQSGYEPNEETGLGCPSKAAN